MSWKGMSRRMPAIVSCCWKRCLQLGLNNIAPPDGAFYIYANVAPPHQRLDLLLPVLTPRHRRRHRPGVDFDPVEGHHYMRFSFAVSTAEVEDAHCLE